MPPQALARFTLRGEALSLNHGLYLGDFIGRQEFRKGLDHITDKVYIQRVFTAEVSNDFKARTFFDWVPVIVGKLEVFDTGAIFVFSGGSPDIHDAIIIDL